MNDSRYLIEASLNPSVGVRDPMSCKNLYLFLYLLTTRWLHISV